MAIYCFILFMCIKTIFKKLYLREINFQTRYMVYRRKGSYWFKTAFPEPYPLQKRSLFAKNILNRDSDIKR